MIELNLVKLNQQQNETFQIIYLWNAILCFEKRSCHEDHSEIAEYKVLIPDLNLSESKFIHSSVEEKKYISFKVTVFGVFVFNPWH